MITRRVPPLFSLSLSLSLSLFLRHPFRISMPDSLLTAMLCPSCRHELTTRSRYLPRRNLHTTPGINNPSCPSTSTSTSTSTDNKHHTHTHLSVRLNAQKSNLGRRQVLCLVTSGGYHRISDEKNSTDAWRAILHRSCLGIRIFHLTRCLFFSFFSFFSLFFSFFSLSFHLAMPERDCRPLLSNSYVVVETREWL